MILGQKNILTSIIKLEKNLQSSPIQTELSTEPTINLSESFEENIPNKQIILKSSTALSSYSVNYATDFIKDSAAQAVVPTVDKQTSIPYPYTIDKNIQTFKCYHVRPRSTQPNGLNYK